MQIMIDGRSPRTALARRSIWSTLLVAACGGTAQPHSETAATEQPERVSLGGAPDPARDVEACRATAKQTAQQHNFSIYSAEIANGAHGSTCRIVMGNERHQALMVAVSINAQEDLAFICNHGPNDTASIRICEELLDGIDFH